MNSSNKDKLVKSLCKLSANLCSYVGKPCDCKFIQDTDTNVGNGNERGSGCPETTTAAMIFANMTNQEFLFFAKRAGITIFEEDNILDVFSIIKKFQEEKFATITEWSKNPKSNKISSTKATK